MSSNFLVPVPAYPAASSHLRGRPRHDCARYAGDTQAGYDPIVGYNMRWSSQRSHKPPPFTLHRAKSASNLALSVALEPLNIKPVERRARPPPRELTPPPVHKVMSMNDLAPEENKKPGRRPTEFGGDNGAAMQALAFSQP